MPTHPILLLLCVCMHAVQVRYSRPRSYTDILTGRYSLAPSDIEVLIGGRGGVCECVGGKGGKGVGEGRGYAISLARGAGEMIAGGERDGG